MRILVVGSSRELSKNVDEFQSACKSLGTKLAAAKHDLLLGSKRIATADYWIALGANTVTDHKTCLMVYGPADERTKFKSESYANLEIELHRIKESWTSLRFDQVRLADVVILIGGGRGTRQAGLIAFELNKPVIPIAAFGGAAQEIWNDLRQSIELSAELRDTLIDLQASWSDGAAENLLRLLPTVVKEMNSSSTTVYNVEESVAGNLQQKYWMTFDGIKRLVVIAKRQRLILLLLILGLVSAFALFSYSISIVLASDATPSMSLTIVGQAVAAETAKSSNVSSVDRSTILAFLASFLGVILLIGVLMTIFSKTGRVITFGMNLITSILGFVTGSITTHFGLGS